ncbi:MAG: hypothetical protein AB1638_08445 [Nitrospirota bacterium]
MVTRNFVLKVTDAKLADILKALKAAGIKVRSVIEIYKEGEEKSEESEAQEEK